MFHFGAKKGILGNRAGKVAPNRKSRRQGRPKPEIAPATPAATFGKCTGASTRRRHRLPLLEIVPAHQRAGDAGCHFWKLYRRTNAPARPPATFKYCTGAPTPRQRRPPLLNIVPARLRADVIPSCPASLFTFRNIYFTNLLIFNTFTVKILEHAPCIGFGPGIGAD